MIYVGTCGYAYSDWLGTFYPATTRRSEMLRYYAQCFCAVEVDASYYGLLSEATIARMLANTPAAFRFCFKTPRTLSHVGEFDIRQAALEARAFVASVMPVVEARKFGCALLQFPTSFKPGDATRVYLRALIELLQPLPLVTEFRNRRWQDAATHRMLCELNVGWCNVDMPAHEALMRPSSDVTCALGYVRFHGRNAAQWWTGDNTSRYDYDYRPEELQPWTERLAEIDAEVPSTFAFFNNHARGYAPRNAELFIEMLRERYGAALSGSLPETHAPPAQRSLFED